MLNCRDGELPPTLGMVGAVVTVGLDLVWPKARPAHATSTCICRRQLVGWVGFVHVCQDRHALYACMSLYEINAAVAMCELDVCLSSATKLTRSAWVDRSHAQTACWVAWKARVVERMPCICDRCSHGMPYPVRIRHSDSGNFNILLEILKLGAEINHTHYIHRHAP